MSITEIVLVVAGVIIFILGYLLPSKKKEVDDDVQLISEDEIRKLVAQEVEGAKEHISDIVDETITYAMEKTERSMERVTNEKIMAVNEYSDTVLEEINKNHQEVLFLYDMLNDKHENLKTTVSEAAKTAQEVKQTVKDAEITAKEAEETVKNAMDSVLDAVENIPEDVAEIHTAKEMNEELLQEVQQVFEEDEPIENFVSIKDIEAVAADTYGEVDAVGAAKTVDVLDAIAAREEKADAEEAMDEFVPIAPPRVAIVHNPEGEYDYVADTENAAEEIAQLLTKEKPQPEKKKTRAKKTTKTTKTAAKTTKKPEETNSVKEPENPTVEIKFANGREQNRNSNERILELHKAGKSNMAIAKELGLGIGEVKLVIDLFEGL